MGQILLNSKELPEEFYQSVGEIGSDAYTLTSTSADQFYLTFNIDNYLTNKYYGTETTLNRSKEGYAKALGSPEFTIVLSGDNPGRVVDLQAFNLTTGNWVTLDRFVTSASPTKYNVGLGNAIDYLNENRLLFTRLAPRGDFKLSIDYLTLDYKTKITD